MSNKLVSVLLIIFVVAVDVLGDYVVKRWSINLDKRYFIFGLALFTIANLVWIFSMRFEALSKIMIFYSVLGVIAGVLVGTMFFGERLSVVNWFGFVFAVISLILINI